MANRYININKNKNTKGLNEQHHVFFTLLVRFIRSGKPDNETEQLRSELMDLTHLINSRLKW
jgi:hypothetical protein